MYFLSFTKPFFHHLLFVLICLELSTLHGYSRPKRFIEKYVTANTERQNLECIPGVFAVWKKNNRSIVLPSDQSLKLNFDLHDLQPNVFPILCPRYSVYDTYTCHNKTNGPILMIFHVNVTGKRDWCRRGDKEKIKPEKEECCVPFLAKDVPCCMSIPVGPKEMNVSLSFSMTNKCNMYKGPSYISNPWKIHVSWTKSVIGSSGTLGWQVTAFGLDGDPNYCVCFPKNSREKSVEFVSRFFLMGAKYKITVQALPQSGGHGEPNALSKEIALPKLQDMCEPIGINCGWEVCFPVKNLTATNSSVTSLVSWQFSAFYASKRHFVISYFDENKTDVGDKLVIEDSYVNLTNLTCMGCKYFVQVQPQFYSYNDGIKDFVYGKISEVTFFTNKENVRSEKNKGGISWKIITAITSCFTALLIVIVFLIIRRRRPKEILISNIPDPSSPKANVFLVHFGHCEHCKNAAHSLANVLCATGYINCHLDLCSTGPCTEGLDWYENKLETCEKVVIIFTNESMNQDPRMNIQLSSFKFVLRMIKGQIAHGNNNKPIIIPVCYDDDPSDVIPLYLQDRRHYSLPLETMELLLCLIDQTSRDIGNFIEISINESPKFRQTMRNLEKAIRRLRITHGHDN
ncbi:uncharacterized protein LOC124446499 [Xenia sp. Carnegie-2017]|uniref:uncharacterized protein LOC124446499 n=1 Tax=Xenia sp. Carnegie-2017 TaxID=2897299 RepID=UPI001F03B0E6|nr:uncharacterized protein LOC124446499 [Xenia sp. Carnegie-2017]